MDVDSRAAANRNLVQLATTVPKDCRQGKWKWESEWECMVYNFIIINETLQSICDTCEAPKRLEAERRT